MIIIACALFRQTDCQKYMPRASAGVFFFYLSKYQFLYSKNLLFSKYTYLSKSSSPSHMAFLSFSEMIYSPFGHASAFPDEIRVIIPHGLCCLPAKILIHTPLHQGVILQCQIPGGQIPLEYTSFSGFQKIKLHCMNTQNIFPVLNPRQH